MSEKENNRKNSIGMNTLVQSKYAFCNVINEPINGGQQFMTGHSAYTNHTPMMSLDFFQL